jgi:PPK2 family polyphosphate:nucleotide phosphotransferase
MTNRYALPAGQSFKLKSVDPEDTGDTGDYRDRSDVQEEQALLKERLEHLQEKLVASKNKAVLFVFQGMDCSGKDGVIKNVFAGLNPQGLQTHSFKTPTAEESSHDFLWRTHKLIPARGYIAAFNRSYYEDVLINRVHGTVSDKQAKRKFKQINQFERMLTDNDVTIVKIFLHISKSFQLQKLIDRIEDPDKHWKFDPNDLMERKSWSAYTDYYEDVFEKCSRPEAPWHIVPSDHRWYRDFAVLQIAVDALERMDLAFPAPNTALKSLLPELYEEKNKA